jgi:methyl-accepting chemotaxis protein
MVSGLNHCSIFCLKRDSMNKANLSLAAKLWVAIGIAIALLVFTLIYGSMRAIKIRNIQDPILATQVASAGKIGQWGSAAEAGGIRKAALIVSTDAALQEIYTQQMADDDKRVSELQKSIEKLNLPPDIKTQFTQMDAGRQAVSASLAKAQELKNAGNMAGALVEIKSVYTPALGKFAKELEQFESAQMAEFPTMQARFAQDRLKDGIYSQMLVLVMIVFFIAGTVWLIRSIRQPLRDAIAVAETIAAGNLNAKVNTTRGDEFGDMMKAIAHMRDQLMHLVADVRRGTDTIATVSEEIAIGNQNLADRTEQTASNLEKAASSMSELTATVKQSAESAQQANRLAGNAAVVAQRGGEVVNQVVTTMREINASSNKISDIISVIDGIAFQTNILALNAAVEAARAGEQGRGFAVVASEVRSLAGRSAEAAKEIKSLINASVEKVEGGSKLVADAGQTMAEIVTAVQNVTDILREIDAAASEQFTGITEVNDAVVQLDQMTQQNAALVEQSAAAASGMKDQAQRLAQVVAVFKLDTA